MMSFFQVINEPDKTCLKIVKGKNQFSINEITEYLISHRISFDLKELNRAIVSKNEVEVVELCQNKSLPIHEEIQISVAENKMQAVGRFFPASNDGSSIDKNEIIQSLRHKGVVFGIREDNIDQFLKDRTYCTNIVLASGKEPRQGSDAYIEYLFNTDLKARPTLKEDGSVDFFQLNIINHVKAGDCLARLHPEDPGEDGRDVVGGVTKPRSVKRELLRFGRNVDISPDKKEIYSKVDGHVTLVEGKVFVSNLMVVENVDSSTGDIDYDGNVQVDGNVCSNFRIRAKGNVEVRGVVEGAEIEADGNVTIARGINGMGKGKVRAGGNVIAKFMENAHVEARGYVESGSILHSKVNAGTEIRVGGKKGFISGGSVCATHLVDVKHLGSELGSNTVVEIGINPEIKRRYKELEVMIADDNKILRSSQPVLDAAKAKILSGVKLPQEQVRHIQELSTTVTLKRREIEAAEKEMKELEELMEISSEAQVVVRDTVYPGTKIVISDVSKIIKKKAQYCRFLKVQGDVGMMGML